MKSAYKCFIYFLVLISTVSCKKEIIKDNIVGKWKIHPGSFAIGGPYDKAPQWLGGENSEVEFLSDGTFKSKYVFGRFNIVNKTITFFIDTASAWVNSSGSYPSGFDELTQDEIDSGKTLTINKIKSKRVVFQGASINTSGLGAASAEGLLYRYKRIK